MVTTKWFIPERTCPFSEKTCQREDCFTCVIMLEAKAKNCDPAYQHLKSSVLGLRK